MISESPGTAPVEEDSPPVQSKQPGSKYEFEGHENIVWDFVFLHDNIHVVSGSADGTMRKSTWLVCTDSGSCVLELSTAGSELKDCRVLGVDLSRTNSADPPRDPACEGVTDDGWNKIMTNNQ